MSPYVEAGYAVVLGTLGGYAGLLLARERRAAARLRAIPVPARRERSRPRRSDEPPAGGPPEDRSG
jgi:hypothetical protein